MACKTVPETLPVVIDTRVVGQIDVESRTPRKIWGRFTPTGGFEPYRAVFEAAVTLARAYDARASHEPIDYPLWDRLMAAYEVIDQLKPSLGGVQASIEEFAIEADWSVEITLRESGAPAGSAKAEGAL